MNACEKMIQELPMVSICCITYNHEPYIRECLDGFIMQQTEFPFEVLIHDDASTDNAQKIIREYEEKYPDIIKAIYQTENQYSKGVRVSVVYNCSRVRGKYVAMCEGDDYWTDPLKLQKQVDFLEANPEYSMCGHKSKVEKEGQIIGETGGLCDQSTTLTLENCIELGGGLIPTSSIVFKSFIFCDEYNDFIKGCPVGDYPLQIFCAIKGKIFFLQDTMSTYRTGVPGSWTQGNDSWKNQVIVCRKMINWLNYANANTNYKYDQHFRVGIGGIKKIRNHYIPCEILKKIRLFDVFQKYYRVLTKK